jgi:transcriptional regulator with XRE-family HTH domain
MKSISEQVRRAILNCGTTRYALSKASGVSQGMLSRYVAGEREMTLRTLDRLAPFIGITVTFKKQPRASGRR